ncbi:MAG: extensin [Rhizobiales bacterium]|nr:extensin [Hyphomicrobiales bacterium]
MTRVRLYIVGSLVLVVLAGCGRSLFNFVQRESWRHEAEVACLKSGGVRETPALVRIEPIDGPGICGADYPLKVAALGSASALGFASDLQPPAPIPGGRGISQQPRWPIAQPPQWQPSRLPAAGPEIAAPLLIHPPGVPQPDEDVAADEPEIDPAPAITPARPFYRRPVEAAPLPRRAGEPSFDQPPPATFPTTLHRPSVLLGPAPGQRITGSIGPVTLKPAATLACPIVSALDQWITTAVQPAAMRWFGQPVVGIRQISAYSCRGMNGNPRARISEHAFGNALDIAAFTLADGRTITIKRGWRGSPEEVGFLHDVQGAACQSFSTVLAPGSNRFHYDHIHVDLMRRGGGRVVCNPSAIPGEVAAARAAQRKGYARRGDPTVTGSITAYAGRSDEGGPDNDDWVEHDGPRESAE